MNTLLSLHWQIFFVEAYAVACTSLGQGEEDFAFPVGWYSSNRALLLEVHRKYVARLIAGGAFYALGELAGFRKRGSLEQLFSKYFREKQWKGKWWDEAKSIIHSESNDWLFAFPRVKFI